MKNYEKNADQIRECKGDCFCIDFVKPNILKSDHCESDCTKCRMLQAIWILEDYEEPETDWSKVAVDTPILVRDDEGEEWLKRHFAAYDDEIGIIYTWTNGDTSWTSEGNMMAWRCAKLAETEGAE